VGASGAAAANAFLFTHNNKRYVITSAHTLFSEPMAPSKTDTLQGATPPSEVTVGRTTLGPMAYSRFFDVAIFHATGVDGSDISGTPYTQTNPAAENCVAYFEDPNADVTFTTTANATDHINRRTECGAFFYKLMDGSSGSALSKDGKLVGMVSGCDQKYENLTIYVPASTIVSLLNRLPSTWGAARDLDTLHIFPNMLTAPIPKALRAKFPESNLSHLVLYAGKQLSNGTVKDANENPILPLTMIEANVANKALDGKTTFSVRPISANARKYFRFPREVYTTNISGSHRYVGSIVASQADFKEGEFDKMCWEGMNVMVSDNPDFLQFNVSDGQSFGFDEAFVQPIQVNRDKVTDKNQTMELFPMSCMYYYLVNTTLNKPLALPTDQNDAPRISKIEPVNEKPMRVYGNDDDVYRATLDNTAYKQMIFLCLARHWVFLVMSGLKGVPDAGYQFIVFAAECRRLKALVPTIFTDFEITLPAVINTIAEFTDLQAMNFLRVLATVFQLPYESIETLNMYMPLREFNKASSNFDDWGWKDGSADVFTTTCTYDGNAHTITFDTVPYDLRGYTAEVRFGQFGPPKSAVIGREIPNSYATYQIAFDPVYFGTDGTKSGEATVRLTPNKYTSTATLTQVDVLPQFDEHGNCSFNINGLEAEHYKINPTLAQATTAARTDDRATDTVGMELELVYAEMERLEEYTFSDNANAPNYYYYPQSFEIVKSTWDHAHITLGNLLPELGNAFAAETTVSVALGAIPGLLRAWPMLESKRSHGSGCHLCTKLKEHAVISDAEFHTITQAITPFAFANHRKELMVYFEFAPEALSALEKQSYNWATLRPFADSMLDKIANKQLESAFQEWMQTILRLKEEAHVTDSLKVLDVQLASC
tara:strand:- start:1809 stop:4457 length:2649 start_codon:yes stop_codon:yes gene_type:complete